jgi:hypothetical protein
METLTATDKYLDLFEQRQQEIIEGEPKFVSQLREEAIASFREVGFPVRKAEAYKYTHLEPVFDGELHFDFLPGRSISMTRSCSAATCPCSIHMCLRCSTDFSIIPGEPAADRTGKRGDLWKPERSHGAAIPIW